MFRAGRKRSSKIHWAQRRIYRHLSIRDRRPRETVRKCVTQRSKPLGMQRDTKSIAKMINEDSAINRDCVAPLHQEWIKATVLETVETFVWVSYGWYACVGLERRLCKNVCLIRFFTPVTSTGHYCSMAARVFWVCEVNIVLFFSETAFMDSPILRTGTIHMVVLDSANDFEHHSTHLVMI